MRRDLPTARHEAHAKHGAGARSRRPPRRGGAFLAITILVLVLGSTGLALGAGGEQPPSIAPDQQADGRVQDGAPPTGGGGRPESPPPGTTTVPGPSPSPRLAPGGTPGIHPAISIDKSVSPTRARPGETVVYTYLVTNVGGTTLSDVRVDDDVLGHIGDLGALPPGTVATLTRVQVAPASTVRNIGTASGCDLIHHLCVSARDDAVLIINAPPPTPHPSPSRPPASRSPQASPAAAGQQGGGSSQSNADGALPLTGGALTRPLTALALLLLLGTVSMTLARLRERDPGR